MQMLRLLLKCEDAMYNNRRARRMRLNKHYQFSLGNHYLAAVVLLSSRRSAMLGLRLLVSSGNKCGLQTTPGWWAGMQGEYV